MPVPKRRVSRSRRDMRRAHHALTPFNLGKCDNCSAPKLPHSACESCGHHKGRILPAHALKNDLLERLR